MKTLGKAILALAAVAGLGYAGQFASAQVASAQAGGDKNAQDAPKDAKESPQCKFICDLELANNLIRYGRQEKHAESLLVAAQILHKTPTQPLKVEFTVNGSAAGKMAKSTMNPNSPMSLLAEARKIASSPQAEALAMATDKMLQEAVRGAEGGPRVDAFTIRPNETITWKPIVFRANEKAEVYYDIGVNGRMVLQVFDGNNNVVATDNVPGPYYRCVWYPRVQGPFVFRLTNLDSISFNVGMATN